MGQIKNVLIVGGGIGGLSLAIALGRVGIRAEVVEIKDKFSVDGVGIIQPGNAVRAYARLGLAEECMSRGFVYRSQRHYDGRGELLFERTMPQVEGCAYYGTNGIERPVLQDILANGARKFATPIRFGVTVKELTQFDDRVEVTFSDDMQGTYDLVVGADGTYSHIREMVFGVLQPRFTGQGCWRVPLPKPPEMTWGSAFHGPNKAGLVPLSSTSMYMYVTSPEPGNPWLAPSDLPRLLRERLAGFEGWIGDIRDSITDETIVVYRPLSALLVPPPWHRGRVLLIGDAVHSTTPHNAQGAAMAVEDSFVASELFTRDAPVPDLLEQFTARRWARCKFVVEASVRIGELELHPTATSSAEAVEISNRVRDELAHAV